MVLPSIAQFASKHNIRPLKKFGQNFIFDETLCDKIVAASGLATGETSLEIGPGPAGLTRSILKKKPAKLIALEMDERCMPLLAELKTMFPSLTILNQDATKIRLYEICRQEKITDKIKIIANLPYNVGTNLLVGWIKELEHISSMTLMLQKEVVERIIAKEGNKNYGRLSVLCSLTCAASKAFDVSPKAFYPAPKVWSSIVHLIPQEKRPDEFTLRIVERITHLAFSARRKMLRSSLKNLIKEYKDVVVNRDIIDNLDDENNSDGRTLSNGDVGMISNSGSGTVSNSDDGTVSSSIDISLDDVLHACQIDPTQRAENISPKKYLEIARYLRAQNM